MKRILKALLSSISVISMASLLVGSLGSYVVLADETTTTAATQTKKNLTTEAKNLYYGYNITGGKALMEADAIAKVHPIIDLNSDYPIEWTALSGEQENKKYASFSLRDIVEEYAMSVSSDIEAAGKIKAIRLSANLGVAFNTEQRVSNVYSEYYEMYSCRIEKGAYVVHNLEARDIRKYLSAKFVEDINSIKSSSDAEAFFNKYGTHLSTGYKYGGLMNITNYKTTSDSSVQLNRGISLDTKISAAITKANAGQSISLSEMYGASETTSEQTSTYNFKSYGGEAVAGVNIDSLFTYNPSITGNGKYEYGRWVDSINAGTNLAIIGVANGCELIPLWDLLEPNADPNIRKYMIKAYTEMCGEKYEEYLKMYPSLNRTISVQHNSENSSVPVIDGSFIKTKNDYFYFVSITDIDKDSSSATHKEVHEGDVLYLSISNPTTDNYEYVCSGCEVVDKRSAIFKVTGKKNDNVSIKYKDNTAETLLLSVPVNSTYFEGGTGTKEYPYLICNADQFQRLTNAKEKTYYKLINDIDFKGISIHPMGTFNGQLDGNYCTISNFSIAETDKWGLFSQIGSSGEIKNLKIEKAGSCLDSTEFAKGVLALNLKNDEPVKLNAITASKAGIICAENHGNIVDCMVNDCYICNVDVSRTTLKDDSNRKDYKQTEMSTGLLAGENSGGILGCMVNNSSAVGAYLCNKEKNRDSIFIYTGGLVGKANEGSLKGCVLINDKDHKIISVVGNNNVARLFDAKNEVRAFVGGLIGYCKPNSTVTLDSVYVQISADTLEVYSKDYANKPDKYQYLKSIAAIAHDEDTLKLSNCYYYCESKSNNLHCYIVPDFSKKADSIDTKNVFKSHDEEFNNNGNQRLDKYKNFYDSTYYFDGSIRHILEKKRSEHIRLVVDDNDSNMKSVYCKGDKLTINGLKLQGDARDGKELLEPVVFNVRLTEKELTKAIDTPLTTLGKSSYKVELSGYGQDVSLSKKYLLEVNDNAVSGLVVENKANKTIYLDKAKDFVSTWSSKDLTVTAILSNGRRVTESDKDFASFVDKSKIELVTKTEDLANGDNYIKVKYNLNGHELNASYIVPVIERQVTSIKIQDVPVKKDYQAGERVDISGIKVTVNYDQGPSDLCTSIDQLSVTGDIVAEGENIVVVTYEGYLNCTDSFTINGKLSSSSNKPIVQPKNNPLSGAKKVLFTIIKVILIIAGIIVAIIVCIVIIVAVSVSKKNKSAKSVGESIEKTKGTVPLKNENMEESSDETAEADSDSLKEDVDSSESTE